MEYIGLAAGILVAFLCVFMYRQGVKDGRALKDNKPLDTIIQKPVEMTEQEIDEMEKINERYQAILNYDPFEVKHGK